MFLYKTRTKSQFVSPIFFCIIAIGRMFAVMSNSEKNNRHLATLLPVSESFLTLLIKGQFCCSFLIHITHGYPSVPNVTIFTENSGKLSNHFGTHWNYLIPWVFFFFSVNQQIIWLISLLLNILSWISIGAINFDYLF